MERTDMEERPGKADTHVHTRYSGFTKYSFIPFPDSVTEPAQAVETARRKKIDVLCITDHNTIRGALIAKKYARDLEVVVGEEISTADGEILALFIQEGIKPSLGAQETIELIREQGGIAIAAHPFSPQCPSLEKNILSLKLSGVEAFNAYHRDPYSNLMAQTLAPEKLARTGGSDAHSWRMIGNGYTLFDGRTGEELYKSILSSETTFGGNNTPLSQCISWSNEVASDVLRMISDSLQGKESQDVLYSKVDKITKKSKFLGLIGASLYNLLPLSLLCGIAGQMVLNAKSRRKWNESKAMPLLSPAAGSEGPGYTNHP